MVDKHLAARNADAFEGWEEAGIKTETKQVKGERLSQSNCIPGIGL